MELAAAGRILPKNKIFPTWSSIYIWKPKATCTKNPSLNVTNSIAIIYLHLTSTSTIHGIKYVFKGVGVHNLINDWKDPVSGSGNSIQDLEKTKN